MFRIITLLQFIITTSVLESMCRTYLGSMLLLLAQAVDQRIACPKMGMTTDKEDSLPFRKLKFS